MDKVVHFEIPFADKDRAKDFYSKVFGWHIEKDPTMEYHVVRTVEVDDKFTPKEPGAINGGMIEREMIVKSPVLVIDVANVDEYLKKIQEAGGKVRMKPTKMGEMGVYARFEDPEGNILGIWQTLNNKE